MADDKPLRSFRESPWRYSQFAILGLVCGIAMTWVLLRLGRRAQWGRAALAGLHEPWPEAGVDAIQQSLQGLRLSRLALKQQTYHALRDLTNAAYFSDPSAWAHLGYPGPQDI